jgi:hypothetical protein
LLGETFPASLESNLWVFAGGMMLMITHLVFWDGLKMLIWALALIYAGLVFTAYEIEGRHYQPQLQLTKPARSGERLLIWTGVRILDTLLRIARSTFDQLFAASAEVGDWAIEKSGPAVQRKVRSKFL